MLGLVGTQDLSGYVPSASNASTRSGKPKTRLVRHRSGNYVRLGIMLTEQIERLFLKLRFDPSHHLGLGDIRLTLAQQDEILELLRSSPNTREERE